MPLTASQQQEIEELLSQKIEQKLDGYGRETASMPFLSRLIQDDEKVAAYSFIHSLSTTLGMSIYEEVSVIIASPNAEHASRNIKLGGGLSEAQKSIIAQIVRDLRNKSRDPDIEKETQEVLAADAANAQYQKAGNIADFHMKKGGEEYYFEIKTVKPNIDVFQSSKTKLLEWVAIKRKPVKVFLAFPYNPYHPAPYERFTDTNMMDASNDFLVGEQYWDFIGGPNTFAPLLDIFNKVGEKYKDRLNQKFKQIAQERGLESGTDKIGG